MTNPDRQRGFERQNSRSSMRVAWLQWVKLLPGTWPGEPRPDLEAKFPDAMAGIRWQR